MAEIKLLEYSQGNKFLDFYKKDSIENEKKYFCCYDYDFSTFSDVAIGRLLFDYQILIYCNIDKDEIINYIVFRVPLLIENSTALSVMIMDMSDIEFIEKVFQLSKEKFQKLGWTKISLTALRYQLTEELSSILENVGLKEELILNSASEELDRIEYAYLFEEK